MPAIGRGVKEPAGYAGAAQTVGAHEIVEGILDLAAVDMAGQAIRELELSKDGEIGGGAESHFELGHSSDFVAEEMLTELAPAR